MKNSIPTLTDDKALAKQQRHSATYLNFNFKRGSNLPEILFITSYPPRECGIATYSQDLLKALDNKFTHSFSLKVCALELGNENHDYPDEVKYVLDTNNSSKYLELADSINSDKNTRFVIV